MANKVNLSVQPLDVRLAAHCIGLDSKDPYRRNGRLFYRPYRNGYMTHDKAACYPVWLTMCRCGHATLESGRSVGSHNHVTFHLTRAGLDWLGETLGITIYDEED